MKLISTSTLLLSFILQFLSLSAKADYSYLSLPYLISHSNNCVVGEIVELDIDYFHIKVEQVIFGEEYSDTIQIVRFKDWPCGKRYDEYKIGQRELVCFNRSNYLIDEFELIGYGLGAEFEMPIVSDSLIRYQYRYNSFKEYRFNDLIKILRDYKEIQHRENRDSLELKNFESRSELHKDLIRYIDPKEYRREYEHKIQFNNGEVIGSGNSFLYTGYSNKITLHIQGEAFEDLILSAKGAKVKKEEGYFTVRPEKNQKNNSLDIKVLRSNDSTVLCHKLFYLYPIPTPTLLINDFKEDSISVKNKLRLIPKVKIKSNKWSKVDHLKYKVLKFDVDIIQMDTFQTIQCKIGKGSYSLRAMYSTLKEGDEFTFYNVTVAFPDHSIRVMKEKTIVLMP